MPRQILPEHRRRVPVSFSLPYELAEVLKKHQNASRFVEQVLWENVSRITGEESRTSIPALDVQTALKRIEKSVLKEISATFKRLGISLIKEQ